MYCTSFDFSGLPYDVTPEQALEHKEVRDRIQASVNQLQLATEKFLERILASIEHIPSVTSHRHIVLIVLFLDIETFLFLPVQIRHAIHGKGYARRTSSKVSQSAGERRFKSTSFCCVCERMPLI